MCGMSHGSVVLTFLRAMTVGSVMMRHHRKPAKVLPTVITLVIANLLIWRTLNNIWTTFKISCVCRFHSFGNITLTDS